MSKLNLAEQPKQTIINCTDLSGWQRVLWATVEKGNSVILSCVWLGGGSVSNARNVMDDLLSILVFLDKGKKKQNFYTEVEQRRSWKCCSSVVDINDKSLTWGGQSTPFLQ